MRRIPIAAIALAASLSAAAGEVRPAPAAAPPPDVCEFRLADGSTVAGKVALKELVVKTAYGRLVVPLADLMRVRIGRAGDKEAQTRIAALIARLGAGNFEDRQKAYDELLRTGALALEALRRAVKSEDAEIRSRAEKLVEEIEKQDALPPLGQDEDDLPLLGENDEVVTRLFTAAGKVELEKFELTTRYGGLTVPVDQVVRASFNAPPERALVFKLEGGQTCQNPLGTRLRVMAGEQLVIAASGSINFQNWNQAVGPEGNRQYFGNNNNATGMALLYRLGASGQWVEVGKDKTVKAAAAGELQFCANYNGNPGQTNGEWAIKVTVKPKP